MTQQLTTFRRPIDVASKGQLQSAKRLIKSKDSQGLEAVRRLDQVNGIETFAVCSKQTYIVSKNQDSIFECNVIDQDGTASNKLCLGFQNCSYLPNPRQEKVCKHIISVDQKFGLVKND